MRAQVKIVSNGIFTKQYTSRCDIELSLWCRVSMCHIRDKYNIYVILINTFELNRQKAVRVISHHERRDQVNSAYRNKKDHFSPRGHLAITQATNDASGATVAMNRVA